MGSPGDPLLPSAGQTAFFTGLAVVGQPVTWPRSQGPSNCVAPEGPFSSCFSPTPFCHLLDLMIWLCRSHSCLHSAIVVCTAKLLACPCLLSKGQIFKAGTPFPLLWQIFGVPELGTLASHLFE
jgi:hypothetical protein